MSSTFRAFLTAVMAGVAALVTFGATGADAGPCGAVACYEKTGPSLVHRTFRNRYVIEPGLYEVARTPSIYGLRQRRILVEPGETIWHETPAVYKTVTVTKRVAGGYTWEYRTINGREVRCKVKLPVRTVTFEKKVRIVVGKRWAERSTPVYGWAEDRVLLKSYKNIAAYTPPYARWTRERAIVQPEGYVWRRVRTPAGY